MSKGLGRSLLSREVDFGGRRSTIKVARIIAPHPKMFTLGLCRCDYVEDLEMKRFFRIIQ